VAQALPFLNTRAEAQVGGFLEAVLDARNVNQNVAAAFIYATEFAR
jgi:hypothetical protein